jgi:hypothetical protein
MRDAEELQALLVSGFSEESGVGGGVILLEGMD